ncbi:vacuolar membrane protein-domain-containing protein [Dipodascopsis tothii]|uniref:vacuolar membrane protein-domain-containing protein n=1 Tax=Dipodascopsis tothii TaxID=44089 RepID=UPI0034CEF6A5
MENSCQLLGAFALWVQGAMGGLAILSLVYKRYNELPRRPVLIWTYDVSKQVVGSAGIHMMNLFIAILSSHKLEDQPSNPCDWYFLNILLDTTIGVPILWGFLTVLESAAVSAGVVGMRSGEYGHPPKLAWFVRQALLYFVGLSGMKFVVYIMLMMPFWDDLASFLLGWTAGHDNVQVAFVMLIFPLIMNMVQYYLVDSIIKSHDLKHVVRRPGSDIDVSVDNDRYVDEPSDEAILVGDRDGR